MLEAHLKNYTVPCSGGGRASAFIPMPFSPPKKGHGGSICPFLGLHVSWNHVTKDMWNLRKWQAVAVSIRENGVGLKAEDLLLPLTVL